MQYDLKETDFFYESIDRANRENKVLLVDFWSRRCEYCRISAPAVDFVHKKYQEKVALLKVEIEKFPYIASRLNIRVLPTQILYKGGKKIKEYFGVESIERKIADIEEDIKEDIDAFMTDSGLI